MLSIAVALGHSERWSSSSSGTRKHRRRCEANASNDTQETPLVAACEAVRTAIEARKNRAGSRLVALTLRRARVVVGRLEDAEERAALLEQLDEASVKGRHTVPTPKAAHGMRAHREDSGLTGESLPRAWNGKSWGPNEDDDISRSDVTKAERNIDAPTSDEHEEETLTETESNEADDGAPETEPTTGPRRRRTSPGRARKVPEHACPCGETVRSNIAWARHRRTCSAAGAVASDETAKPDAIDALLAARAALRQLAPDARRAALALLVATSEAR